MSVCLSVNFLSQTSDCLSVCQPLKGFTIHLSSCLNWQLLEILEMPSHTINTRMMKTNVFYWVIGDLSLSLALARALSRARACALYTLWCQSFSETPGFWFVSIFYTVSISTQRLGWHRRRTSPPHPQVCLCVRGGVCVCVFNSHTFQGKNIR